MKNTPSISWAQLIGLTLVLLWICGASASAQGNHGDGLQRVSVQVQFAPIEFNRANGHFETSATVRNRSNRSLFAPLRLLITHLKPDSARALHPTGFDSRGRPYYEFPLVSGVLNPGETTAVLPVRFALQMDRRSKHVDRVPRFRYKVLAAAVRQNVPPVANAGPDQTSPVGESVTLDGSGSTDGDGDRLSYRWSIAKRPESSVAALSGTDTAHPTLTIDRAGDYHIALVVRDGRRESSPDTVIISTVNSKPTANAGPDQTAFVGTTALLDGSESSDRDGDALRYHWSIKAKPDASEAELSSREDRTTQLRLDQPGHYEIGLIVDDGLAESDPDAVFVDTENSRPVAVAGPKQTATVGGIVHLDGSASNDADADALAFSWSLVSTPHGSKTTLIDPLSPASRFTPDLPGSYVAQLLVNDGLLDSIPDTTEVTVAAAPNHAPKITSSPPGEAIAGKPYSYQVHAYDPDDDALTYSLQVSPAGLVIDPFSGLINWTPLENQVGRVPVQVTADDQKGGKDTQNFEVGVKPDATRSIVPKLLGLLRPIAEMAIREAGMRSGPIRFETSPLAEGIVIEQTPPAGGVVDRGTELNLVISLGPDPALPPNPSTVAPTLDPATPTTTTVAADFLFAGTNPIQTGVSPGSLEGRRIAVIRGRVTDRYDAPLPGAVLTIKDHPEYGKTTSRVDGAFDLAVNGGGTLILNFNRVGYLPAQRAVEPVWQQYSELDDVALVELDAKSSSIELGAGTPMQVAQGSVVSDKDGTRQATALFPEGIQASMALSDGTLQPLSTLTVRATEYTVGNNGPESMPGPLPPTSGYTYAIELSVDEARAAGADTVRFDRPVPIYVDNFLGFPTGMPVPAGYYDRNKAAWIPSENGRVIKLVSTTDQIATIDVDGDGSADDDAALSALGITETERQQLAQLFTAGATFWRVPITHFTPWDFNWPYGPPADAVAPTQPMPRVDAGLDDPDCQSGSIIECQTQTLGEVLPIVGTSFTLNYRSDRTTGRTTAYTVALPLSGPEVPASLKRIELEINVAGRNHRQTFLAAPHQSTRFLWDGLDGYGRRVNGKQTANIRMDMSTTLFK